jgi:hypothetical protein
MEPYLWKTRPDGINVINIGKTWYALMICISSQEAVTHTHLLPEKPRLEWLDESQPYVIIKHGTYS